MNDSHHQEKPQWVPDRAGAAEGFTTRVMKGLAGGHDGMTATAAAATAPGRAPIARRRLDVDDYVKGILAADRQMLARAITLMESHNDAHQRMAQEVLTRILPAASETIRVGITGVPGAGKSSLIEALGTRLCARGHKVAVLAVDPSSSVTGGSILGDKTRMEMLSRNKNAFIRPSPTGGVLGGVARKSREALIVCEAAGFDVILLETVGVGQSEITVRSMVDFFVLVQIAGAGDELQGIKKGVMELSDLIVVNKADGDNQTRALAARADYERILHYLQPATRGWTTPALACSAYTGQGIEQLWSTIERFRQETSASGVFSHRRRRQKRDWMHSLIEEHLKDLFYHHPAVARNLPTIQTKVENDSLPPTQAALQLIRTYEENLTIPLKSATDRSI